MTKKITYAAVFALAMILITSCNNQEPIAEQNETAWELIDSSMNYNYYENVELKTDLTNLSDNHKEMLRIMFQVADIMEELFWLEAYGDKTEFLSKFENENLKRFGAINYGPWERLNNNEPYLKGFGAKPAGANFYPHDMTVEEFEALADTNKTNQYTLIQRAEDGSLKVIWYHEAFKEKIEKAAELLKKAAVLAEDEGLKKYLNLRAEALLTDNYQESDFAWMEMKTTPIDFVVGPIENYEDKLFNYKAAYESFILIKDLEWSEKLSKFAQFLPQMQKDLPVDAIYKKETPGSDADLNAYDVIYYAGDCNAGSKTIAINLPNDPVVQLKKGSRKLQLKNAMRAKFDKILVPIANELITKEQRGKVSFDAFFANTMFHEVAHGMGIKMVVNKPDTTVRQALKDQYTALEEGKADILGLYIVTQLNKMGELTNDLEENYVTFMAGIFRSIRFGAASSHGKANMIRFNYFLEREAFTRLEDGTYQVNFDKMKAASEELTRDILKIQGDGNYKVAKAFVDKYSVMGNQLQEDLKRLDGLSIPKDIYYTQGPEMNGL
ncbi:MAG: Zn-dependent hydrolase [Bacteroidales bacterium]|nr:Zn-dependent hydrolase [Bacteroidales bacterium]